MLLSIFVAAATFLDVQDLIEITGFVFLPKVALALIALLHLKRRNPDTERTIQVE